METSALTFARPALLHFLWLLPLVVLLFWWAEQRRRALIGRIVAPKLRNLLAGNTSPARRSFRAACVLGALGLLVVTMAGPQLGYDTLEVPHKGRDVIIAMDVSRSMLATDVAPTRLQRAKLLAEDLISELAGDRLGLVAFAGSAFLQAPLTLDHGAVLTAVDELDTDLIPKGGSNLAAAIRTCEEAFGKAEGFSRAIVIISDGEELDADGLEAARQAAADGIRIFTVGVGSEEGSEIPLGPGEFVRDPSGKIVQSRLDAARMREIAEITGGFYVPLDESAARKLAADGIGQMKEVEMSASTSRRPIERFQWPLAGAIGLLMLQALVGERRRRPLAVAAALWMLSAPPVWSAPSGLTAYEQGDYQSARTAFEQRLQMEPDSPSLQLNAGTAAYRLKDYGKASEYFSRAMLAEDPALRSSAEFNLGNTLFRQGEGQEDKEKKITDWKDAIAKYEDALKTRPDYAEAKENKERVEELLKQLEQEQPQQDQKKDQQNKDQQKQDQQQQGGQDQKQDQQQGGQDNKEQKDQGQQQKQDQQQGGQQKDQQQQQGGEGQKDDQQQGQQKKDEQQPSADGGQDEQEKKGDQQKDQQQQGGGKQKDEQEPGGEGQKEEGEKGKEKSDQGQPDQPDDQGQEGQKGDEQKKDGEGGEGEEEKEGGQKPGQDQSGGGQGEEEKQKGDGGQEESDDSSGEGTSESRRPEPGQAGDKPAPVPQQGGDKKEGELRAAAGQGEGQEEAAIAAAEAEEEVEGQMSASQARALLRSLQNEEEQVDLRERRNFQDVSRDW
jgi:Ca-activated chloride channel family protein